MKDIVIASGNIAATYLGLSGSIAGGATVVPLASILVAGGVLCTVVAIPAVAVVAHAHLKNKKELELARLAHASGDPRFYLQSISGHICSAELNQEAQLTATRDQAQEWEFFEILKASDGRVAFRASNGKVVSADRDKGGLLIANRDSVKDWELFSVEQYGDYVALKASNGCYVSRRQDEHNVLFALANKPATWEMFRIMKVVEQVNFSAHGKPSH